MHTWGPSAKAISTYKVFTNAIFQFLILSQYGHVRGQAYAGHADATTSQALPNLGSIPKQVSTADHIMLRTDNDRKRDF